MGTMWNVVFGFKAMIVMVVVQIMFAGTNVLYKLAANDGMIVRILVAYRFIFAAAFMVPLALYDENSSTLESLCLVVPMLKYYSGGHLQSSFINMTVLSHAQPSNDTSGRAVMRPHESFPTETREQLQLPSAPRHEQYHMYHHQQPPT
ncbi:hypothetical protein LguiA_008602 [Lonicera macranthoides]